MHFLPSTPEPSSQTLNVRTLLFPVRATDKRIACDEELSDSEDEGEGGRKNVASHKKGVKRARVDDDKKEGEEKKTGESVSRDKECRRPISKGPVWPMKFHWGSSHLLPEIKEEEKTKEISGEKSDSKT